VETPGMEREIDTTQPSPIDEEERNTPQIDPLTIENPPEYPGPGA
jgi:hypothetical protein